MLRALNMLPMGNFSPRAKLHNTRLDAYGVFCVFFEWCESLFLSVIWSNIVRIVWVELLRARFLRAAFERSLVPASTGSLVPMRIKYCILSRSLYVAAFKHIQPYLGMRLKALNFCNMQDFCLVKTICLGLPRLESKCKPTFNGSGSVQSGVLLVSFVRLKTNRGVSTFQSMYWQ